ncbi:MAG: DUF5110 domain-containing protein [Saprospiraceae bacterium]|nr:DUF5110 domain-containing protein [Saprospiraceae bacterium]
MFRILIFFFAITIVTGCKQSPKNYLLRDNTVIISTDQGEYEISSPQFDMLRVDFKDDLVDTIHTFAPIVRTYLPLKVKEQGKELIIQSGTLMARVKSQPFSMVLIDEKSGQEKSIFYGYHRHQDRLKAKFSLDTDESIYGGGSRAISISRRGKKLLHYNRPQYGYGWGEENLNYSIPHLYSSEEYMLLIDDPARGILDIGNTDQDTLTYTSKDGNPSFYYINGSSFSKLINLYTNITGTQTMPPLWAFGHLQSRFGYRSQKEAEETLDKAIKAGYPVDAIILDIYWFGPELEDGKMGQLDWDTERWPDPKGMIERFHEKGVKVITVSEPFFTRKSKHYEYLSEQKLLAVDSLGETLDIGDFYFGAGGLLDIFKPEARDWMWDQYKYMKSFGIDGWWVDLGEPEKHPDTMYHANGPAYAVHGIYGHEWARMLHEGFKEDYPEERLFHMGRSGYAGTQRYGLIPWTGDVGRNWSGFKAQTSMMLSMGLSGIPFMHSDAGGFSMGEPDEELYIRWMQYAVFTPIFRPHADASIPPEPVFWPQYVQDILKPYIDLRYQLLPYHYTMAFKAHRDGTPMARPLFLYDEAMPDTIQQQYMWGDHLLVNPVTEKGLENLQVHLPKGRWYDFWTDEHYDSGTHMLPLTIQHTPVMVAEGAILPLSPNISNTEKYRHEDLTIHYYLGSQPSEEVMYMDDGKDPDAFETGAYRLTKIKAIPGDDTIELSLSNEGDGFPGFSETYSWKFTIHGLENSPVSVSGDDEIPFTWDTVEKSLMFETVVSEHTEIKIQRQ